MKHKIVNFRPDRISGWFHDPEAKETKSVLQVTVDGEPATQLVCNIFRSELDPQDFPSRNIGFLGTLPPQYWTGETYDVALVDPLSKEVLTSTSMESLDRRLTDSQGLAGDLQVTDRGEVFGWASQEAEHATVKVVIDGKQVDRATADLQQSPWKDKGVSVAVPFGHAYAFQVPEEYFDDDEHRIQVLVEQPNADHEAVDLTLKLASSDRQAAAATVAMLATGRPDWSTPWRKRARTREDIQVENITLTARYAHVTLVGEAQHQRLALRLRDQALVMRTVSGGPEDAAPDDEALGRQRYAAVIPPSKSFSGSLPLENTGDSLATSYDLRLGDAYGPRPSGLPPEVVEDTQGQLRLSEVSMDAAAFDGWAFNTAGLDAEPVDIVLTEVQHGTTHDIARVSAIAKDKKTRLRYGVSNAGYSIALPPETLTRRTSHLRLEAEYAGDRTLLWEDSNFYPQNHFLHSQALGTSSSHKALDLLTRARRAGRKGFVEAFLGTHRYANASIRLEDLEAVLGTAAQQDSTDLQPASSAIWYWVNELRTNSGRINWFTQNAIRNKLGDARDVLAYCATKGSFDFSQVHGLLESCRTPQFRSDGETTLRGIHWRTATLSLARFLYASPRDEIDHLDSLTLYRLVEKWRGIDQLNGADRAFYGDLLRWRGDIEESARVLAAPEPDAEQDYSQRLLALNALNPSTTGRPEYSLAWLSELNTLLESGGGVAPIALKGGEVSFFNLTSELPKAPTEPDAPLVSVVMPIYEPSPATDLAVDSLLKQTWSNLEIIMVDDCSPTADADGNPTGYRKQLESYADRDERIRLVFNTTNRGAYSARNDALDLARGTFVTVADKDDWHHPQQIELQVRHLMDNPDLVANETNWSRVDENLKLLLRSATGRVHYPSMPSLMFRREQVINDLGYWDTVRKSGDSEFKSRLENYYGIKLEPIIQAPLAFALMEGANLTKDDMGVGYLAPDRRSYLRAYKRWHRGIREEQAPAVMPKNPSERPFIAPPVYLPGSDASEPVEYDVVFASEFGFVAGNSTSLFTEISVCLSAGLRVAVLPFQNGLIPSAARRQFNRRIDELVLSGEVDRISLDTKAHTKLLICRWPTAMQLVRDAPAAVTANRAVVVANHPPYEPGGRRSYDIGVVTRNSEKLFGVRPTWAPQSEQIGEMLKPLLPASDLEDFSWKGIINTEGKSLRTPDFSGAPTLGRHGRDDPAKWPSDRTTFRNVYPIDGSTRVCILGGAKTPTQLGFMPPEPAGWEVYAFNEITVDEYLTEKLDFFVYFHSENWIEAFGMVTLEAMTYGVVCVLPDHFQPVFGDAAIYARPDNVQRTVSALWKDPDAYRAQQRQALSWVQQECTPKAYLRRLAHLGLGIPV